LVICQVRSQVFAWVCLQTDLSTYGLPHSWDDRLHHHTQLLEEDRLSITFCLGWP
jgi:hypothetical protein